MPNWCDTYYAVYYEDKNKMYILQILLNELFTSKTGNSPLCLATEIGVACPIDYAFNGHIFEAPEIKSDREGKEYLLVHTEEAWFPHTEATKGILESFGGVKEILMLAEEPGSGIFINTDLPNKVFEENFYVEYEFVDKSDITGDHLVAECERYENLSDAIAFFGESGIPGIKEGLEKWPTVICNAGQLQELLDEVCNKEGDSGAHARIVEYTDYVDF